MWKILYYLMFPPFFFVFENLDSYPGSYPIFSWIGLDRIGLDRIGSDWIGSDWIGLDRIGSDWIGSGFILGSAHYRLI
jgi:hypothetical protein